MNLNLKNDPADGLPVSSLPDDSSSLTQVLDDEREWSAFSRPCDEDARHPAGCWESNVLIEGMHCAACAGTVEAALRAVPGVLQAEVNAGSRRARVVWQAGVVLPSQWMGAVQQAGFRAVPANDTFARERRQSQQYLALWRWRVSGLCMVLVMVCVCPSCLEWMAGAAGSAHWLHQPHGLRWASWVLTLPVVCFSCWPFFASAWRDVTHGRISMDLPVALGMLITFGVSSAGTFYPDSFLGCEVYFDALTMFVFFLLSGRWLEARWRDRTAGALEALMNRLPDSVLRQTASGSLERVSARSLRVQDVIRVLPGEAFAADGIILQGSTSVDQSLLTGESRPVSRQAGDAVISGSHNLQSAVWVQVEKIGADTRFAQIVRLMESAATTKPAIARLADRMAGPFLAGVLLAAGAAGAYWWGQDPQRALMVAVSVLIVTCPCALSLATPSAILAAAGSLARRGVLVRRLDALAALASVDTVMFDKTGTLTRDALMLGQTLCRDGVTAVHALALAAALAQHSLHPASRALVTAARAQGVAGDWQADGVTETSGAGLQGRAGRDGAGQGGAIAGATDAVDLRLGSADFCGVALSSPASSLQVHLSDDRGWLATFDLQEDIRPDAACTVAALQHDKIAVHLLSGDAPDAVRRVAGELGIASATGGCSPQDKLDFLRDAQSRGRKVAVVGDGLNDGPLLAGAQVSFAVGNAVPLTQTQADLVLSGTGLGDIVVAVVLARRTLRVIRQNLAWAAIYNAVCVPLAVAGWLPAWLAGLGMAASSALVVLNALRLAKP